MDSSSEAGSEEDEEEEEEGQPGWGKPAEARLDGETSDLGRGEQHPKVKVGWLGSP